MNRVFGAPIHIHAFFITLILALFPKLLFSLVALAIWLVPIFALLFLYDNFKGTVIRKATGLIIASIILSTITGLLISYFIHLLR